MPRTVEPAEVAEGDLAGAVHDVEGPALCRGLVGRPGDRAVCMLGPVDTHDDGPGRDLGPAHARSLLRPNAGQYGTGA